MLHLSLPAASEPPPFYRGLQVGAPRISCITYLRGSSFLPDRRDRALYKIELTWHSTIERIRQAFVQALLEKGHPLPADYVYQRVDLPADWDPKRMGGVFRGLCTDGVIRSTGYVKASRPSRHAGPVQVWELVSEQAARDYLARTAGTGPALPAIATAPPGADAAGAATGQHASHAPCPAGDRPGAPPAARPAEPNTAAGTPGLSAQIAGSLFDDEPDRKALEEQGWLMAGNGNRRGRAGGWRTSKV